SEDRPLGLAFRNLFPFLFQKSGYGYFHLGTPKDLERYDEGVVRAFWKRQKAKPWVMAVCGRFDRDKIMDLARNLAKEGAKKPSFTFQKPEWSKERVLDLTLSERNQAHLLVVFSVSGSRHEDAPGLDLLRTVLAGQGGILFRDLRDKQGLGYTVTAFLWRTPKTGFLAFYIGTYPDKVDEALAGFENTVLALREDLLSKEELARAKNLIRGEYHRDHQSLSSRSLEAAGLVVRGFELNHNVANLDKAAKLSPKDLRTLARKYLNWDDIRVLRVLP
ncbi:MAG: insulinase family protein, partial [Thermodesulfobacteriota bacterium]|nr:insulinase family protein [Thermodesulfobacteriota bacterium]